MAAANSLVSSAERKCSIVSGAGTKELPSNGSRSSCGVRRPQSRPKLCNKVLDLGIRSEDVDRCPIRDACELLKHQRASTGAVTPYPLQELPSQSFRAPFRKVRTRPFAVVPAPLQQAPETDVGREVEEDDGIARGQSDSQSASVVAVHHPSLTSQQGGHCPIPVLIWARHRSRSPVEAVEMEQREAGGRRDPASEGGLPRTSGADEEDFAHWERTVARVRPLRQPRSWPAAPTQELQEQVRERSRERHFP